jgi:hypothetical protein
MNPKFKVGDFIKLKDTPYITRITEVKDSDYVHFQIPPYHHSRNINNIRFVEQHFTLVTKLELYLLGLENEENTN